MYLLLPWIALVLFACAAALWKPLPRSRGRFRAALGFLGLWVILWAGASTASSWHTSLPALRQLSLALIALAAVQVIAGVVFDFAVERAGVPRFAGEIVVVATYVLVLVNLLYTLGVNVTGIFATSAVATAVIGLSLQDMLGNIASGIALEFENDIRVGDFIKCGESSGWVQHVRLRHTAIETPDGDSVMLPNSFLTRSPVMVLSRSRRQFVPFTMPYAHNPQELTDAVTLALQASPIPDVAVDPRPFCIVLEMAPGHIRYAAVVWMLDPGQETFAVSAVLQRIYFALRRAGIPATEITHLLEMKAASDGGMAARQSRGYPAAHADLSPARRPRPFRAGRETAPPFIRARRADHPARGRGRFHVLRHQRASGNQLYRDRPLGDSSRGHLAGRFLRRGIFAHRGSAKRERRGT